MKALLPTILFRYTLKKFLMNILFVYAGVFCVVFVVDLLELLRRAGKSGSIYFSELVAVTLLRVPSFTEITLQITVLIAAILSFLMLSRSSELTIIRASGVSIWRFLYPFIVGAIVVGLFAAFAYNPLSAWAKAESEKRISAIFNRDNSILNKRGEGAWLRQEGEDGPSVLQAKSVTNKGLTLSAVSVIHYDKKYKFKERIDAKQAVLKDNYWELRDCWVSIPNKPPKHYKTYQISTFFTKEQITENLASTNAISFWALPEQIRYSQKAGLSATRFKIQYNYLLSTPILLAIMVLIAATCSMRIFRFGKVHLMAIMALAMGFGFFGLSEFSRQLGLAEIVTASTAIWVPLVVWSFVAITALLYMEDG